MGGSSGYTLPEDFDPVGEGWTPPVSVQRRGVVAPPADYRPGIDPESVSYTHLTLPTIYSV